MYRIKNSFLVCMMFAIFTCKHHKAMAYSTATKEIKKEIKTQKPNFIFYLADDQDQLDYGCYGNTKVKTPNVDKLAEEGLRFTNFYTAQAICAPARSQIFTGMYPLKNGCMANHLSVKPTIESVTTLLQKAGYEVILAGKSHVKPDNVFSWTKYFPSVEHRYLPLSDIDNYLKNATKPFCIFITSDYPHGPYPETTHYKEADIFKLPYEGSSVAKHKTGYYQNIEDDNEQLGKVLKMVDDYGFRNNSVFIYASDHGLSGKWSVKEKGLKVPFIARWPSYIKPNTTSSSLVSFVDVLPTLLDIASVKIPETMDGKSFYSILKGNKEEIHNYIYGVATQQNVQNAKVFPSRSIRGQRYKLIKNFNAKSVYKSNLGTNNFVNKFIEIGANSFPNVPYEELYDLEKDPYETTNLASKVEFQNIKKELSLALKSWMVSQNDFLITHKMPLLKPTLHPLDKVSQWNKVDEDLVNKLVSENYLQLHY